MTRSQSSQVIIESIDNDLRQRVETIMTALAPRTFAGASVLIKPNMVGPSAPELGHTTHPELLRAVVLACLERNARVIVGDNPGGMNRNSRHVASITGILDASSPSRNGWWRRLELKRVSRWLFPGQYWRQTILSTFPYSRPISA